jgi:hypothetical protein
MDVVMKGQVMESAIDTDSPHASAQRLNATTATLAKDGAPLTLEGYVRLHVRKKPRWVPQRLWQAIIRRALVLESFGPYQPRARVKREKAL